MSELSEIMLTKAEESLAGAASELANGRFNNCANRCYYTCFQAAVAALYDTGIHPARSEWSHKFVQTQFAGTLIRRRKLYASELGDTLSRCYTLREAADYRIQLVTLTEATRMTRRSQAFVDAVRSRLQATDEP